MARRLFSVLKNKEMEEPVINLTPLIDVVFVVLIMFILIAPLLEYEGIELANGAFTSYQENISVHDKSPINIQVRKDNSIWYNNQSVTLSQLADILNKTKNEYPKAVPQLFHDKEAHFGTYQSVKNTVEQAGFEQMNIVLNPV